MRDEIARHARSIWVSRGESQTQWRLLQAAVDLVTACADATRLLPDHQRSLDALIDFYVGSLREVDRRQRELEQAVGEVAHSFADGDDLLEQVAVYARAAYRRLVDRLTPLFVRHVETTGWPPPGRLANADVFDKFVAPRVQESGRRVALIQIDALRFELGVELRKVLAADGQVDLTPACAQLPTVTPVGMASLLPDAGRDLTLARREDKVLPMLGEQPLPTVTQRMEVLRRRYGQRFADIALKEFVHNKAAAVPGSVELTDYLAEAFHYQFGHTNRYEEVNQRIRLGAAVEGRDEKGIKKTVAAFLKMLHPDGPPDDDAFEEYVAYAVEGRRRVKEQMNKRKPDDEFARINLSFFTTDGREVVVYCPESQDAPATQQPTRKVLDGAGGALARTAPVVVAPMILPPAMPPPSVNRPPGAVEALSAESVSPVRARPVSLTEQHYTIRYGDTGYSYESIMADYLQGARRVTIEDPYIRATHQLQNFVRFCEMMVSHSTIRHIRLVTGYDDTLQRADAEAKLADLTQSLLELDIMLEVAFDANLHDREIRLDNGWVIKIGRGLDFYQKPSTWYEIGSNDLRLRKCLETKVDVYRHTMSVAAP